MAIIRNNGSDWVQFYIQSPIFGKVKIKEPIGWSDDDLELDRAKHHGIFNLFTNPLNFAKKDRDLIEDTFYELGQNSSVYLIKEELEEVGDDIKWVEKYRGKADWETRSIKNSILEIRFNSDELEELVKANESDELEIETQESIDGIDIGEFETFKTSLLGRNLVSIGVSKSRENPEAFLQMQAEGQAATWNPRTEMVSQGPFRHVTADVNNLIGDWAVQAFYVDQVDEGNDVNVSVGMSFDMDFYYTLQNPNNSNHQTMDLYFSVYKLKRNPSAIGDYEFVGQEIILDDELSINNSPDNPHNVTFDWSREYTLAWDEGLMFLATCGKGQLLPLDASNFTTLFPPGTSNAIPGRSFVRTTKYQISINETSFEEASQDLTCTFIHDVGSRMMAILANDPELFYSKYFGRTEIGYAEDGEGALVGLMSGYWIRAFSQEQELYKSPVFSWKKFTESINAVFNVGIGTQLINNKKVFRCEPTKFFYQQQVVVELGQVTNLERKYDKELYFSGIEIGYSKGGDYENEAGLDEPNIKTNFVSPDRKSKTRYRKISDIRSDETEMEILRRKPAILFSKEDTGSDSHNWFVDLKRAFNGLFEQVSWEDRLESEPTGVNEPQTYRSFFLTPLRMLFRHGWIIRSGLETLLDKTIKYASASNSNSNLTTHFQGEPQEYSENIPGGLPVSSLERSRLAPEKITFSYKLDKETLKKIYGFTRIFYNGAYELVPNYYFKFSWINEKQETEYGYLMNMKPEDLAKFTMQKSNERPI